METFIKIRKTKEFQKDFKKLSRKFVSLPKDLHRIEKMLTKFPIGKDEKGIRIFRTDLLKFNNEKANFFKLRVRCESLNNSGRLRLIYFYDGNKIELIFIEIYFKGKKQNEDKKRIERFWNNLCK